MEKILKQILTSRVYEAAVETPLNDAIVLSQRLNNRVRLKREDLQHVFSFKLRGAYNKIAHLSDAQKSLGVITASAGNHAQGVAYASRKLGITALIVMPVTTPIIKINAVKYYGGEIVLHGNTYSDAAEHAKQLASSNGMVFVHPFDDELVIAGQGTVADELLRQNPGQLDAVFIPVGGGGLLAGMAAYIKSLRPEIQVIGVEPYDSSAMAQSLAAGKIITLDDVGIFADGVAVKTVGQKTFELCKTYVDRIINVNTDEICGGIKATYEATRSIVEPAGGLALAGILKHIRETGCTGQTFVGVNSGANMNFERLRYVAERTLMGEKQEALFAVSIPEKADSLKTFCHDMVKDRNITEFNYRMANRESAQIFVGISTADADEKSVFSQKLTHAGYKNIDLTDNELAKTHIRYMVGGRCSEANNERFFRFWFPERPGALVEFLEAIKGRLNISLFHYRAHGGDFGRVLVGLEVPAQEDDGLVPRLENWGTGFLRKPITRCVIFFYKVQGPVFLKNV